MNFKAFKDWKLLIYSLCAFCFIYFLPMENPVFRQSLMEGFELTRWYAREHVILCLIPAFFIAGAISVFLSQESVMKYLGPSAPKFLSYGVASVSGTILAVCSCTVLPLFAGISSMGAGIGPATAFLYSGPAVNILSIVLTWRVLGIEIGIARALGAIVFSIVIGLLMAYFFKSGNSNDKPDSQNLDCKNEGRPLWQTGLYFLSMVGILVFSNWGKPQETNGVWFFIYSNKWIITSVFSIFLGITLVKVFNVKAWKIILTGLIVLASVLILEGNHILPFIIGISGLILIALSSDREMVDWVDASWVFAKQIMPLLLIGVFIAGMLLGKPGSSGLIPSDWVAGMVGGNSLTANFFASFSGAFMYFATLTEVPILEGLIGNGMGKGPALALLLAGPALSLPNMLVIRSVIGNKKTLVFISLVIIMATFTGFLFGLI